MPYTPLSKEQIKRVLIDKATEFYASITIDVYIIASEVGINLITAAQGDDIMNMHKGTPNERKAALLGYLQRRPSLEMFIAFCLDVLVKNKNGYIVTDVFGLKIKYLEKQRDSLGVDAGN